MAANSLSELGEVNGQIARLQDAITALKAERDDLILALIDNGFTEREVAIAAGVSNVRVHQIKTNAASSKAGWKCKYHDNSTECAVCANERMVI